jgi:hypothetical protein
MPTALTSFPEPTAGGTCNTSCFSPAQRRMFILRDDAYDWDVLGHEFFHFTANVFSQSGRSIDNNPGGSSTLSRVASWSSRKHTPTTFVQLDAGAAGPYRTAGRFLCPFRSHSWFRREPCAQLRITSASIHLRERTIDEEIAPRSASRNRDLLDSLR